MAISRKIGIAAAALAFVAGAAGSAAASTEHSGAAQSAGATLASGNSGAWVTGATGLPAGSTECRYGDFCIYTGTNDTGTVFRLARCQTYALHNWNGYGSWFNNETFGDGWGTVARIKDSSYRTITSSNANPALGGDYWYDDSYNFAPAWYVTPC